ncbi:MAG: CaiB/BaiF CoA transferase family protein [Acidimicrobiales bacterium]
MLPLDDVRVLDLTVARAGPTAVRQLADWGADVIRVEAPPREGGNEAIIAADRHGSDFQNLHRNKRSVTIDLKSEAGRAAFYRLVETADVVVENWRAPVKTRLGVDYESLRALNPRLVYGSISGFGQEGPYADRGGVDQIAQGLGGLMSITGLPGQGPVRVGVPIADLAAGMYLSIGILVALHERDRTGEGRWVHTSLLESQIAMLDFQATRWTMDRVVPPQAGNHHPTGIPMGCFPTADGHINIAGPSGRLYKRFCEVIGAPELLEDPLYKTAGLRSKNREQLNARVEERLRTRPSAEWIAVLNEAGVPCGPVYAMDEVFADPQVRHLGIETPVAHPSLGELAIVRNAVNLGGVDPAVRRHSPDLGEHTDEVLAEAGFTPAEIAELRAAGAV